MVPRCGRPAGHPGHGCGTDRPPRDRYHGGRLRRRHRSAGIHRSRGRLPGHRAARRLRLRLLLASITRATHCHPVPGRGRSRAHTAPVQARPYPASAIPVGPGHPAGLWPPSPQLAGHANIRRALPSSLRRPWPRPEPRTDGSAQRISASNAGGSRHRYLEAHCSLSRTSLAGSRRAWAAAPATIRHGSAVYQQVALIVTA